MELMKGTEPDPHFACLVVYQLCVRSEKELQNLRVGNIFPGPQAGVSGGYEG